MSIQTYLQNRNHLFIKQRKEITEMMFGIETANKYNLIDETGQLCGGIEEKSKGFIAFWKRMILRSHRPLTIDLFDQNQQTLLHLSRGFFWFFSDLFIQDSNHKNLGSVHRKFALLSKRYELLDASGNTFAHINAGLFKIWTFDIFDNQGTKIATISKKWGGLFKEVFSDADQFGVSFQGLSDDHKAIVLGAAISIDFDFFEENSKSATDLFT